VRDVYYREAVAARFFDHELANELHGLSSWIALACETQGRQGLCYIGLREYVSHTINHLIEYRLMRNLAFGELSQALDAQADRNRDAGWVDLVRDLIYSQIHPDGRTRAQLAFAIVLQSGPGDSRHLTCSFLDALENEHLRAFTDQWPQLQIRYTLARAMLTNLLKNASKYQRGDKPVELRVAWERTGFVDITVYDFGEPFEPDLTHDEVRRGRHMGLKVTSTIMLSVARRWPGATFAQPKRGETQKCFVLRLPVGLGEKTLEKRAGHEAPTSVC
jgi:signal transduction histidine kinase